MIEKRRKLPSSNHEVKLLDMLKLNDKTNCDYTLDQGGLVQVSPLMLPFFEELLDTINIHINAEKVKEHGKYMIEIALDEILENDELEMLFKTRIQRIGIDVETIEWLTIQEEFTRKVFHSRVNEFMEARKELELERITDAGQSLRDTLKTYSTVQKRRKLF
jgi:hypothetical protein